MNARDKAVLAKIVQETTVLGQMLKGMKEAEFLTNEEKMRASCMTLINIGELVKHLSQEFRAEHSQIPWRKVAGLRDVAAHGYFSLHMADVWIYAAVETPQIAAQIKKILDTEAGWCE